jgi:hypothetical protein
MVFKQSYFIHKANRFSEYEAASPTLRRRAGDAAFKKVASFSINTYKAHV